jgi:hypothetical protein
MYQENNKQNTKQGLSKDLREGKLLLFSGINTTFPVRLLDPGELPKLLF